MARFSPIGGYLKVTNNSDRWYGQSGTPKCLPKQGVIAAQISLTTREVKQTNGKENVVVGLNRPMEGKM